MTGTLISHGTFTVKRRFAVTAERLWRAWTQPEQMREWAAPAADWSFEVATFDFRPGGVAICRFGPPGEVPYQDVSRFDDILPQHRIVSAYAISKGDVRISSSVSSVEFLPDGDGTLLRITELGAYLDGRDSASGREGGVRQQLEHLAQFLVPA